MLVDNIILWAGVDLGNQTQEALLMDIVVTLIVAFLLYPLCMIKEFHKIKTIGMLICISNGTILVVLAAYLAYFGVDWYKGTNIGGVRPNNFLESTSIFNAAPEFCFTFHFQIYFLIVL